ncbi:MAG: hypothetical protein AAF721_00285 [Myxococcota bacterium]
MPRTKAANTKPQPKKGAQTDIKGTRKVVKVIEDAATEYVRCRDIRMEATPPEVQAKQTLIERMQKHGLEEYRLADGRLVVLKPESFKVQVKPAPELKD